MLENLDRIEKLVESNAKSILALTARINSTNDLVVALANQGMELNTKIDRTSAIVTELANVVYAMANRQEDQEHRIDRLEDRL